MGLDVHVPNASAGHLASLAVNIINFILADFIAIYSVSTWYLATISNPVLLFFDFPPHLIIGISVYQNLVFFNLLAPFQ